MPDKPRRGGAVEAHFALDLFLQSRPHRATLALDILDRPLDRAVAVRVAHTRVIQSRSECSSSIPGYLSRKVHNRRLLILLDDHPVAFHPDGLEVLANLMHDPLLVGSLLIDRIRPDASAFGFLHH